MKGLGVAARADALSLAEIMVAIAILGILAAVAIPMVGGTVATSKAEVAQRNLNVLNGAVLQYNQSVQELTNSVGDHAAVVALLRTRDTSVPGSPFIPTNWSMNVVSTTNSFRASWNGRAFAFLVPGMAGSGVDLLEMQ
ncbi:MAG: hypothetical protein Fur0032_24410 [Terrimicrobiaceae bacterium]